MSWLCALLLALGAVNRLAIEPGEADAIAARLDGHRFALDADRRAVTILDVAGEGPPRIGVVERADGALWLIAADRRWRLAGPLARPRIAGPGYTVWVIGREGADGEVATLTARRLGVLRRPARPVRKPSESRPPPPASN